MRKFKPARIPPLPEGYTPPTDNGFDPLGILRDFDYGNVKRENGRTVREFEVTANSAPLQLNRAISFVSWNLNGRVPGPTLRARAGERVRVLFHNEDGHSHSMHFHGTHPVNMDGIEPVRHGKTRVYEFTAEPFGVHPYHCHIAPVTRHISKGLYGLFIVDPPEGRPPADEMIMVMGGFDINNDGHNELYAFNGIPNYYRDHPIPIYQNQLVRLYLLNMVEFDSAVTFHLHANLFQIFPTGRTLMSVGDSDVITMGTAERHILEFSYKYPGKFMFHPHQDAIAALPEAQRQSPDFVMAVIVRTLQTAAEEYEAAIADNKIVETIEYQDSRGFVLYADEMYQTIAVEMEQSRPKDHAVITQSLQELQAIWPSVTPPETPLQPPDQVYSLVSQIELRKDID